MTHACAKADVHQYGKRAAMKAVKRIISLSSAGGQRVQLLESADIDTHDEKPVTEGAPSRSRKRRDAKARDAGPAVTSGHLGSIPDGSDPRQTAAAGIGTPGAIPAQSSGGPAGR